MPRRPLLALVVLIAVATPGCREPQGAAVTDTPRSLDALAAAALATLDGRLAIPGLRADVQVLRDEWGVPHIFAQSTDDLFLAQGFVVAQDRLWQMEIWRRTSEGRLAELVGPAALPHDRLWRLMRFRGPIDDAEWSSYHPEARRIFAAYAAGVNAFIAAATGRLPVEFVLTGITPEPWTAEQLLHRARIGDAIAGARAELRLAQSVARMGVREAGRKAPTIPADVLTVPAGLDVSIIDDAVIAALDGDRYGEVPRPPILEQYRGLPGAVASVDRGVPERSPGSNNWAISGRLAGRRQALMVDDPHRQVTNPAHRYLIHLNAPGWTVAGATEAPLPG
jgi:penicillin G amidase